MRIPLATAAVALLVLTSACGSSAGNDDKKAVADTPSTSATVTPSTGESASSKPATTPSCTTKDLTLSLGQSEGTAGSTYVELVMTNTSGHACRSGGYGGVSYVAGTGGKQVGAPADRDRSKKAVPFVLIPNAHATATVQEGEAGNYDSATCRPAKVAGLRVYPPNQTASAFVKAAGTGCANGKVHLLMLSPYVPTR